MTAQPVFQNEMPVSDLWEALKLLSKSPGDGTVRTLRLKGEGCPCIEVALYSSGYTKEEYTRSEYYRVDPRIAEELQRNRYVEGIPRWGSRDAKHLRISSAGEFAYRTRQEFLEKQSRSEPT